jgi:hypothetical protein
MTTGVKFRYVGKNFLLSKLMYLNEETIKKPKKTIETV